MSHETADAERDSRLQCESMKTKYTERIADVREMMSRNGWDAVVVSGSDPHSSEYPSPRWQQVNFLLK